MKQLLFIIIFIMGINICSAGFDIITGNDFAINTTSENTTIEKSNITLNFNKSYDFSTNLSWYNDSVGIHLSSVYVDTTEEHLYFKAHRDNNDSWVYSNWSIGEDSFILRFKVNISDFAGGDILFGLSSHPNGWNTLDIDGDFIGMNIHGTTLYSWIFNDGAISWGTSLAGLSDNTDYIIYINRNNATHFYVDVYNSNESTLLASLEKTFSNTMDLHYIVACNRADNISPGSYIEGHFDNVVSYSEYVSTGNVTSNIRNSQTGFSLLNTSYNGSVGANQTVDIYGNSSDDGITNWTGWILIKLNALPTISYDVGDTLKKQYYQVRYKLKSTLTNETQIITALITETISSLESWDVYIINETQTLVYFETSNYTAGLQGFNITWGNRIGTTGNTSTLYYQNGTKTTSNSTYVDGNVTLIPGFLIPEGTYYIQETADSSTLTIPANSWGMFNNWTGSMTFAGIAANESNDICYTYYNVTSGLWESYYVGYSWNSDYQLSKDASVMGYFNAQTDITSNIRIQSSIELYTGWNMLALQGSSNQTISTIITDIGSNCSDVWYFNSSIGAYSNTTSDSIQPNRGVLGYITQNMTW